jgi:hypothetical protein
MLLPCGRLILIGYDRLCYYSNMLAIRFDAIRICRYSRRPMPTGAQNIGTVF